MNRDLANLNEGSSSRSFSGVQAAKVLDLSYRQIDHWLSFFDDMSPGSGQPRQITMTDIVILAIVREMRLVGISLSEAVADAIEIVDSDLKVAQWSPSPNTHVSIDVASIKEEIMEAAFDSVVSHIEEDVPRRTRRFY